jgi:hypothetical protein
LFILGEYLLLDLSRMTSSKTVTTEYGKQNIFGTETKPHLIEAGSYSEQSELLNGRLAMIGFVAAAGAYITTGQLVPGVF